MAVVRHISTSTGTRDIACANPLSIGGGAQPVQFDGSAAVSLVPGTNVTMTNNNGVVTIAAAGGGGGGDPNPLAPITFDIGAEGTGHTIFIHARGLWIDYSAGGASVGWAAAYNSGQPMFTIDDTTVVSSGPYSSRLVVSQYKGSAYTMSVDGGSEWLIFRNATKLRIMPSWWGGGISALVINGGYVAHGDFPDRTYNLDKDYVVEVEFVSCLSPDTIISTPNGNKMLKDVRVGDVVWSVDGDGRMREDTVSFCDSSEEKYGDETDIWTFDDGTVLRTIHPHEFYSADERRFKYIADFHVGERIVLFDGRTPALADHKVVPGRARHMTMFTERFNTYFADGALAGNRNSVKIREVRL